MYYSSAPVRIVDADTNQIQEHVMQVESAWFEDLAPDVVANPDTGVSSLSWRGSDITTISDQWIVQLNHEGLEHANSVSDTIDLLNLEQYNGQVIRGLGMAGLVLIQTELSIDHDLFMDSLIGSGFVDYVQPNAVLHNQATMSNDTSFINQWGLNNTGQFTGSVADADIDAPEAWDLHTGSNEIVVGIIDTGVKYDQADLKNNMWINPGEIAHNGIDDDGNGFIDDIYGYDFVNNDGNPADDNGHGTHVAGIVAADGNNGFGVSGVSWNSKIMALKFMGRDGTGSTSDAVRAINYATMMKTQYGVDIQITNNSWGGQGYSTSLYNAIVANKEAGMLFIAAAGNESQDNDATPYYPADYNVENIITVAATDWTDQLASYSNYGATSVDVAAPGTYIYSTVTTGASGYMSGTSMAAPMVSGLAALAWSYDPDASWQQIKAAILDNGDTLASLDGKVATGKRINAYNTLKALTPQNTTPDPSLVELSVSVDGVNITNEQTQAIDFGTVYMGERGVNVTFTVTNTGQSTLVTSGLTVSGGFSVIDDLANTLDAGESDTFIINMATNVSGERHGVVRFTSNDLDESVFSFNVVGTNLIRPSDPNPAPVGPLIEMHGDSWLDPIYPNGHVYFDSVNLNTQAQVKTFTIRNAGDADLTMDNLQITGNYEIVQGLPSVLAPDASGTFKIRMLTSVAGINTGTVSFDTNGSDNGHFKFELEGIIVDPSVTTPPAMAVTDGTSVVIHNGQGKTIKFGDWELNQTPYDRTFTVYNRGRSTLNTSNLSVSGDFEIIDGLSNNIAPGSKDTIVVRMLTNTAGIKVGTGSFKSNDPELPVFKFNVGGTVTDPSVPTSPEVGVTLNGESITDGQSTAINFGTYEYKGNATWLKFLVSNTGQGVLTTQSLKVTSGFYIQEGLSSTIAPGGVDTFTIGISTQTVGEKFGTVSFKTNDSDEALFNFNVTGKIVDSSHVPDPAEVAVKLDGTDITDGTSTAIDLGNKTLGKTFQKAFTVTNTGDETLTLANLEATGDFSIFSDLPATLAGGASTTFIVQVDTNTVGEKTGSITFNTNDSDEATFNFLLEASVTAAPRDAELKVTYSGGEITDDQDAAIDFGTVNYGDDMPAITFTVTNTGDKPLSTSSLKAGSGFTIVKNLAPNIAGGQSDTFIIRMTTSSAGEKNATVSFYSTDEDESNFNFDITGSVTAPPDGIDLSVAWADQADAFFTPGKKSKVMVDVTNNGTTTMSDSVTVNIYGNTSNTLDGNEILLGTATKKLTLKSDQIKTNSVVIELDSSIAPDDYYLFAVVDPDNTIDESNEDNNAAVSSTTSEVAWKFGDLGNGKKTLLKLTDSDGTLVTFNLTGNGCGQIIENNDGTWSMLVTGTNKSSKIAINAKGGDNIVELRDITIGDLNDDSDQTILGQFAGKNVDLNGGDFTVTGSVSKLILGDVTDTTMTFMDAYKSGTDITLDQLTDVIINAQTGFNKFTIIDWSDTDNTADELNASWINKLSVKGSKKADIAGNFETDLNLSNTDASKYALNTVSIKGAVDGRTWDINGNIKNLKIDSVDDTDITVNGIAEKVSLGHMIGGSFTAHAIGKLATSTAKNIASNGSFNTDLDLSGSTKEKYTVKTLSVKGDITNADMQVAGKIGALVVKGQVANSSLSVVDDSDLRQNAVIEKLVLKEVSTVDVSVEGNIGLAKADRWQSGSFTAEAMKNLKINRTFSADLDLSGNLAGKDTLTNMSIGGNVYDSDWNIAGSIKSVSVKGTVNDLILKVVDCESGQHDAAADKLIFADITAAVVSVDGDIEFIKADTWSSGSLTAESINKSKLPEA